MMKISQTQQPKPKLIQKQKASSQKMVLEPPQLVLTAIVNVIVMVGLTKIIAILETVEVRIRLEQNFATCLEGH
jgi:hypothetical protein